MTIILADPNLAVRRGQHKLLDELELNDIHEVKSGKEVIGLLNQGKVRLIVLGDRLPDAPVNDFIKLLHKKHPSTPIVYCTSDHDMQAAALVLKTGARNIVLKPFAPVVFKDKIAKTLGLEEEAKKKEQQAQAQQEKPGKQPPAPEEKQ